MHGWGTTMKRRHTALILFSLLLILLVPAVALADSCGGHGQPPCPGTGCGTHGGYSLQECSDGLCWHCCAGGDNNDVCGEWSDGTTCDGNPSSERYDNDCDSCGAYNDPWCNDPQLSCNPGLSALMEDSWIISPPNDYVACCDDTNDCVTHGGGSVGCNDNGDYFDMNPGESSLCANTIIWACTGLFNPGPRDKQVGDVVEGVCCNGPYDNVWSSSNQWTTSPQPENTWNYQDSCADGSDNDCDGLIDCEDPDCAGVNGCPPAWCAINPDALECQVSCEAQGYVWTGNGGELNCCGDDFNEDDPYQVNEILCDGHDNDCDGAIDEGCPGTECADDDGDGYNVTVTSGADCGPIDCDDTNPAVNPGATEVCTNDIDDDCDGAIDENDADCQECTSDDDCDPIWCPSINDTIPGTCDNAMHTCQYDEPPFSCITECSDDVDNDGDTFVDFDGGPFGTLPDPGCTSFADDDETNECSSDDDCIDICPPGTDSNGWPWYGKCVGGFCQYNSSDCDECRPYYWTYDYNNDGRLDGEDVSILTSVVFGASCPLGRVCDVNDDGTVDASDVIMLAGIVAGNVAHGEICDDLLDNDCDGLIDDEDPDCHATQTCDDTDGGINYPVQGTVTTCGPTPSPPCHLFIDHCLDDQMLVEYFCNAENASQNVTITCEFGCRDGACLPQPPGPVCGDGVIQPGETCDGNPTSLGMRNTPWDWGPITGCSDFDNFTGGTLSCDDTCHFDTDFCTGGNESGVCGDGVINTGETCDGFDWGLITGCSDFDNFTGGSLACGDTCHFDTSLCTVGGSRYVCNDTDGGFVPLVYGETTSCPLFGEAPCFFHVDACLDAGTLAEGFCLSDDRVGVENVTCEYGCRDGACLPQPPGPVCGDGVIQPGETCDGENWGPIVGCSDFDNFTGGDLRCDPVTCLFDVSQCIGGNESGVCGDGVINTGETCDGSAWGSITGCADFDSFTGGSLSCIASDQDNACHFDTSACTAPEVCTDADGDGYNSSGNECGIIDCDDANISINPGAQEVCDNGVDDDCDGLIDTLDPDCQSLVCGDGVIQPGEQCDDSAWGSITGCADFDSFTGGTLSCDAQTCLFDTSNCTAPEQSCGDGVIQPGEECDGTNWGTISDCTSFDSFQGGTLNCDLQTCLFDTSGCEYNPPSLCGNGILETGEECDGSDFAGASCGSYGYNRGSLACTASCTVDKSGCYNGGGGGGGGGGGTTTCRYGYVRVNGICVKEEEGNGTAPVSLVCDADGDGYVRYHVDCIGKGLGTDCDDHDRTIYPGAEEVCGNGKDDNCDGQVDEGCYVKSPLSYNSQISVPVLSILGYDVTAANLGTHDLQDVTLRLELPSNWEYSGPVEIGTLKRGGTARAHFAILVSEDTTPTQKFRIILEDKNGPIETGTVVARVETPAFAVRIKPNLDNYADQDYADVYIFLNNKQGKALRDLEVELDVNEGDVTSYVQYLGVFGLKPYATFRYRYEYPIDRLDAPAVVEGWLSQDGTVVATSDDTLETVYHPTRFDKDARSLQQMRILN